MFIVKGDKQVKSIKYIFKTLFNNARIVEGRKRKWYEALIVFVLAIILSVVPTIVSIASVQGSSIITSSTNSMDVALVDFSKNLNAHGIKFFVRENDDKEKSNYSKIIEINDIALWNEAYPNGFYSYSRNDADKLVERLRVYYYDVDENGIAEKVNDLRKRVYNKDSENEEEKQPIVSHMFIGRDVIYILKYSKDATSWESPSASRSLNFSDFDLDTEIISCYHDEHALSNWTTFIDKGYSSVKTSLLFAQVGIYMGINIAVSFFMGLVIFIITRGKKNPFREIKFTESMKMIGIASLCPALLCCILGFLMPAYSTMMFMMFLGVRIMWMSSKCLSPYTQDTNQNTKK